MDYAGARSWLDSLGEFHMEFGLDRVRAVLARLGNPERGAPAIHVAGTNGKGMTCAHASGILRRAGTRVGLYTSPHLSRPNERIAIDGRPIGDGAFAAALTAVRSAMEATGTRLTYFEAMTAAAFQAFRESGVEVRVVEVGLGGRLDATNVLSPAVTVITSIALDHTALLGPTIAAIAAEKAGILKAGVPLVLGAAEPDAVAVIEARARELGVTVRRTGESATEIAAAAVRLLPSVRISAAEGPGTPGVWPGRHELLPRRAERPAMLLDGAHNPAAAGHLVSWARVACPDGGPRVLLVAAMADKDVSGLLGALFALPPASIICTSTGTARSAPARSLAEVARAITGAAVPIEPVEPVPAALARACERATPEGLVLATGSLYLVGRVRELVAGGPPDAIG